MKTYTIYYKILFFYSIISLLSSCSNDDNQDTTTTDNSNNAPTFYFTAKIDGIDFTYNDKSHTRENKTFVQNVDDVLPSDPKNDCHQIRSAGFAESKDLKTLVSVEMINYFKTCIKNCEELKGKVFELKEYEYGIAPYANKNEYLSGAAIKYIDDNEKTWCTYFGTAIQKDSDFKIIEISDFPKDNTHKIIKATFSCILYDTEGASKALTDGEVNLLIKHCDL